MDEADAGAQGTSEDLTMTESNAGGEGGAKRKREPDTPLKGQSTSQDLREKRPKEEHTATEEPNRRAGDASTAANQTPSTARTSAFGAPSSGAATSWDDVAGDDEDEKNITPPNRSNPSTSFTPSKPSAFGFQSNLGFGFSTPGAWKASQAGPSFAQLAASGGKVFDKAHTPPQSGNITPPAEPLFTDPNVKQSQEIRKSLSKMSVNPPTTPARGGTFATTKKLNFATFGGSGPDTFKQMLADTARPTTPTPNPVENTPRPPVTPVPRAEVTTGEEHEKTVHVCRCKLYVLQDNEWKERGVGQLKINLTKDRPRRARLIMRKDTVHTLILNVPLSPAYKLLNEKATSFATTENAKLTTFSLRVCIFMKILLQWKETPPLRPTSFEEGRLHSTNTFASPNGFQFKDADALESFIEKWDDANAVVKGDREDLEAVGNGEGSGGVGAVGKGSVEEEEEGEAEGEGGDDDGGDGEEEEEEEDEL
ncbi:hypothetical protein HDV00_009621 [Rhizophlyctis rosea]|nr:hypothetical protein HDV00_009621 [Rhizophlyctis rosea]